MLFCFNAVELPCNEAVFLFPPGLNFFKELQAEILLASWAIGRLIPGGYGKRAG